MDEKRIRNLVEELSWSKIGQTILKEMFGKTYEGPTKPGPKCCKDNSLLTVY